MDRRVDIYAAGVALWELVTGQRAWTGLSDIAILGRVSTGSTPSLAEAAPDAPAALVEIADKALAFDRGERFATAGAMRDAIRAYMRDAGIACDAERLGAFVDGCVGSFCRERRRTYEALLRSDQTEPESPNDTTASAGSRPPERRTSEQDETLHEQMPHSGDSTRGNAFATSVSTRVDTRAAKSGHGAARTRAWWAAAALLSLAGLVAILAWPRRAPPVPVAAASDGASVSPRLAVRVTVTPADAVALVDGVPTPTEDGVVTVERRRGDVALVRLTAAGFDATELRVRFDETHAERVELRRRSATDDAPPSGTAPTPAPVRTPKRSPAPNVKPSLSARPIDETNPFD